MLINLFEMNIKNLNLDKVYKNRIFIEKNENIENLKKRAYKENGVLDLETKEMFYYKKFNEESEIIEFNSLKEEIQIQLLQLFLIKEKKIFSTLSQKIKNLYPLNKNYYILKYLTGNVFKIDNKFYLSFDIKNKINAKYNLLSELNKNLINKQAIPINGRSIGTIKEIIYPNEEIYEKKLSQIIDYFKQKNIFFKIKNEPLVGIQFKNNTIIYSYFASDLKFVYTMEDINENLTMPNFEREKIIQDVLKNSNINFINYFPLKKEFINLFPIKFNGNFKSVNKIKELLFKKNGLNVIYPKRVPETLKNRTIPTIILIDENIKTSQNSYINNLFKALKEIKEVEFELKNRDFYTNFSEQEIIKKVENYNIEKDKIPPLIILIGSNRNSEYYETTKRKLFKLGFISQNIIYENLVKVGDYEVDNLLLQILVKYGMYPYTISIEIPYDYILGIDVGNDKFGNRNIAGGVSVINKNGILEKVVPINIPTNGEKIDLSMVLEELSFYLELENKNILILRDGKLTKSERNSILDEFKKLKIKNIVLMNIVKRHSLRVYDTEGSKGIILKENLALLLAHKHNSARPIKIDVKVLINEKGAQSIPIKERDLRLLYALTNLNYSNIYLYSQRLRLPAPIHYADKFVKALGKRWEVKKEFLLNGFLYFI